MKTQSADTSPEMEKVYFDILRRLTTAQRLEGVRALTASAIHRERQWLARANPEWDENEVRLQWMRLAYGEEIEARVREKLSLSESTHA
jgi:hypothetical protein